MHGAQLGKKDGLDVARESVSRGQGERGRIPAPRGIERMTCTAEFRGCDPHTSMRIYRRDLPHWRQNGATYFVTFRLADSIPAAVIRQWGEERRIWYEVHGCRDGMPPAEWMRRYRQIDEMERRAFERQNARRLFEETDAGHGCCALADRKVRGFVLAALGFFRGERCWSGDAVVMPNHVHWLVQPINGGELETLLASIKRHSATQVAKTRSHVGAFWQRESYDHIVRNRAELDRIRRYVQENPQRAGLKDGEYDYQRGAWLDEQAF